MSLKSIALSDMQKYCSLSEKCKYDIVKKLSKYQLESDEKEAIIADLCLEGYIDHNRFANAFVHDKFKFNKWGKLKLKYELQIQKIESVIIQEALNTITISEYEQMIRQILEKKIKTGVHDKEKLIKFMQSKGFELTETFKILNQLI